MFSCCETEVELILARSACIQTPAIALAGGRLLGYDNINVFILGSDTKFGNFFQNFRHRQEF